MAGHSFKLQKLQSSISHISTTHLTPLFHQIITTTYLPLKNRVKEVMNWGTKKTVRKMKDCSEPKSGNAQRKWISKGRVHDEDDDELFWRISFSKETYEDVETICNSDYRLDVSSVSSGDFKKTSNGRTIREFIAEESQFQSNNLLEEHKAKTGEMGSTEFSENKPKIVIQEKSVDNLKSLLNSDLETVVEGYEFEDSEVKNVKIDEVMLKNEKQRRRSKKGRKVKAYSPKISFEDMKKTRMKMEEMSAFRISVGSIAVVKSSFDPERDFGDSMMEMMIEKGIRQREELEELLACYLTLNCDEYHGLIIKVFKQTYNKFANL